MDHYEKFHYVCHHPDCAGQECSVFNSRLELMEHKRLVHHEKETLAVGLRFLPHAQLRDLFAGDELAAPSDAPHVSPSAIEAAKVFLVEDPSGWTAADLRQRAARLDRELLDAFRGDAARLDRYQKLTGEFLRGAVSAAAFYDVSLNVGVVPAVLGSCWARGICAC